METPPASTNPPSPTRRTSTSPKPRTPLQERSQSEANRDSGRLGRDGRQEKSTTDIFTTTPFPTKPQHILLPSTLRKQRSFRAGENQFPRFLAAPQDVVQRQASVASEAGSAELRVRRAPVLQLKRSVTTLRDMYEAQAERSRPSTAASNTPRPGTASSRLRSASSSEGLHSRTAWESLHQVSADDLALLPNLSRSSLERLESESTFAARAAHKAPATSSPNYRTFGSSSPRIPVFRDPQDTLSDEFQQTSSSGFAETSSSSPNFVRLGRSSSLVDTLDTEQTSSSPNIVKLGTSSPGLRTSSSPTPSITSTGSRKRKRTDQEQGPSFAQRTRTFTSSPPYVAQSASVSQPSLTSPDSVVMPSSPPEPGSAQSESIGTSSPVYRLPGVSRNTSDSSSSINAHTSLQAALSSSPAPPIQYPIIRAPSATAFNLNIPKRVTRNSSNESGAQWNSRLSPVPSEWEEGFSRPPSNKSHGSDRPDDEIPDSSSIVPISTNNESQVRIIPITEDDQHEATDELGALPRGNHKMRSPPLVPIRTFSLYGTTTSSSSSSSQSRLNSLRASMDTRLNSMKSFSHSRQNSFMSGSVRPTSSGSQSASVIVPTWARRYYSGFYRDSFHYLYPSQNNSTAQLQIPNHHMYALDRMSTTNSHTSYQRASTPISRNSRRSWQSVRNSLRSSLIEFVPSVLLQSKSRPQLEARKSHLTAGIGPLVSNPIQPEASHTRMEAHNPNLTIRRVSECLPPVDPRAHWAGISEEQANVLDNAEYRGYYGSHSLSRNRSSAESESVYYDANSGQLYTRSRFVDMPRLHHDRRLNTGSSRSRGFGFPFNQKSRWRAPSVYDSPTRPSWFQMDFRDAQVTCFIIGFLFPISWFVAAFLPLPRRPESFEDIEKAVAEQEPGDVEDMDIVARLRLERHVKGMEELKWQNARWWRTMNRWMSAVGVVVVVLVIVLAVIGTRNNW